MNIWQHTIAFSIFATYYILCVWVSQLQYQPKSVHTVDVEIAAYVRQSSNYVQKLVNTKSEFVIPSEFLEYTLNGSISGNHEQRVQTIKAIIPSCFHILCSRLKVCIYLTVKYSNWNANLRWHWVCRGSIMVTTSDFQSGRLGSSPSRDHYSMRLDRGTGLIRAFIPPGCTSISVWLNIKATFYNTIVSPITVNFVLHFLLLVFFFVWPCAGSAAIKVY